MTVQITILISMLSVNKSFWIELCGEKRKIILAIEKVFIYLEEWMIAQFSKMIFGWQLLTMSLIERCYLMLIVILWGKKSWV